MPLSWVSSEDALRLMADMLTPPITTVQEITELFEEILFYDITFVPTIDKKHVPHLLNCLHQVGSVLHYSQHSFLRDFVFLTPQFVVDVLKTLYRHDINLLSAVDQGMAHLQHDVTDVEFETMKRDLTENGSISMDFLRLMYSHFGFNSHHYELLVNLLFKFDLAYPKCKDHDTHRHITHLIQKTMSHGQSGCYNQLKEEHELPVVSGDEKKLRDCVYFVLSCIRRGAVSGSIPITSDQPLLSALDTTGSSLLLPWFLPDPIPSDLPTMSLPSSACSQVALTYAFQHCVPLGLLDRLSARSSCHSVYTRHWKSGLYFQYGSVVAMFKCMPTRPLPTLTFTVAKSSNNMTRLCHVMWRYMQDITRLLETMPGAVVNRYLSREALQLHTLVEVGTGQSIFCPVEGGPSFHVQGRTPVGSGISSNMLSAVKKGTISSFSMERIWLLVMLVCICVVAQSSLASVPLDQVFADDVEDALSNEHIRAVARDIKEKWTEIADCLCIPDDIIDELTDRGTTATVPLRMLKKFRELMPESVKICVLCDALYEAGLQSVADKHFNPYLYTDRILRRSRTPNMMVRPSAGVVQCVTSSISKDIGLEGETVEFQSSRVAQITPADSVSYMSSFRKDGVPDVLPVLSPKEELALSPTSNLSSSLQQAVSLRPVLTSRLIPLETPDSMFGSEREIEYSVFDKRVECYKWIIAAHITNGSVDVYEALASKRKNDNYIELKHPMRDYIESDGRIWLDIKCKQPWRLCQGKQNVSLNTKTIWRNDTHSSCYHDFEVEDCERSAPTLRCTIKTYFEDKDRNISRSVQLVISQTSR